MKKKQPLKTYNVSYAEEVHYTTTEIRARSEAEARKKFTDLLNNGMVDSNETNSIYFEAEAV